MTARDEVRLDVPAHIECEAPSRLESESKTLYEGV